LHFIHSNWIYCPMIYSGPYSQISTTISISMLINQPSDLDNESQNNAWVFDSSQTLHQM